MINKLTKEYLLTKRNNLDLCLKENSENVGRIYRRRADVNLNLYLTEYVLNNTESIYCKNAFADYQKAIKILTKTNSGIHLSEAILAYGNAIKEQFLPLHKDKGEKFTEYGEKAKKEYKNCIDLTLNINYLRGYFFTMLEQMNLEIREKVWGSNNRLPKRLIIFHSLESPLSHKYLKGIYYFAYKHFTEVWEYNYGRVPCSNKNKDFIFDRLFDASGVIFLCSPNYKKTKKIVKFEVNETEKLINKNDPIKVLSLNLGNKRLINELRLISVVVEKNKNNNFDVDFEKKIQKYLKDLKYIYCCRKIRCKNNT